MTDIRDYIELARDSGAYKDIELEILRETLASWSEHPGDPCSVVELGDGKVLAGFAVFARAPNTDYTYDVRAICVEKMYRGKGVGQKLAEMIEEEAMAQSNQAVIRFEISRRKEESIGAGFLLERGFSLIGHIEAFYSSEDDYYIYAKHVTNRPPAAENQVKTGEGPAPESGTGDSDKSGSAEAEGGKP